MPNTNAQEQHVYRRHPPKRHSTGRAQYNPYVNYDAYYFEMNSNVNHLGLLLLCFMSWKHSRTYKTMEPFTICILFVAERLWSNLL